MDICSPSRLTVLARKSHLDDLGQQKKSLYNPRIYSLAFQIYIFISKHLTINILHWILLRNTIILRQKHINRNTKREVNIESCNLTLLPLMDSLSLLSGSIHNPGWRFCHLLSLLPRASIINRWLVEVTGAASVGEKQVEVRGSSYHSEKNTDRLSKAETAEKSGRDAEFRVAGRRSGVNKQRIKGNRKWQQQERKGGMWGTKKEVRVASVQRQTLCLL